MKTVPDDVPSTGKPDRTDRSLTAHRSRLSPISWLSVTVIGSTIVAVSLEAYQIVLSISTGPGIEQDTLLERDAYATLFLVFAGLVVVFLGLTYLLRTMRVAQRASSIVVTISGILSQKRFAWIFAAAALAYGFVFAAVSSTIVYQPGASFSATYGVQVPSILSVVCCGPVGQMPQFVIYLTQQFAILLIPVNVVLLFLVSWLVGLNTSVAAFVYWNRPVTVGGRWIGGLGAIVGLFTACPTCAGFFLLTMLGLSGAVSLALTLASLQGLFILAGIPMLVVAPLLTIRKIGNGGSEACSITGHQSALRME